LSSGGILRKNGKVWGSGEKMEDFEKNGEFCGKKGNFVK
jgi:hypothetical protein